MARPQVLLVDDDRRIRDVVALALSETCDVKQAATGAEALGIVRNEPVAAVVLDYRLPDRSGLDVLTEIRAANPRLPVVMITGYGSERLCALAFKLGARDYFPKPVALRDLRASLSRLVSESPPGADRGTVAPSPSRAPAEASVPERDVDPSIEKAIEMVELRYWDDLSLGGLARELAMSRSSLSRRFKEAAGTSFRSYLLRVRLERAKTLLARKRPSVTEVAHAVGFGDLPRFDKLFKRATGLTPSAFRAVHVGRVEQ